MSGIVVSGLTEVMAKLRKVTSVIDREVVTTSVAEKFVARLRAATPVGYSGRLRESVLYEASEDLAVVGYDEGVETAGNSELDSVLRPGKRGKSVLKWSPVDELTSVMEDTFDGFASEAVTFMETSLAGQIDGIT